MQRGSLGGSLGGLGSARCTLAAPQTALQAPLQHTPQHPPRPTPPTPAPLRTPRNSREGRQSCRTAHLRVGAARLEPALLKHRLAHHICGHGFKAGSQVVGGQRGRAVTQASCSAAVVGSRCSAGGSYTFCRCLPALPQLAHAPGALWGESRCLSNTCPPTPSRRCFAKGKPEAQQANVSIDIFFCSPGVIMVLKPHGTTFYMPPTTHPTTQLPTSLFRSPGVIIGVKPRRTTFCIA